MLQAHNCRSPKFLFINPPRCGKVPVIREDRCEITERSSVIPPYSLLQMAAILRENGHCVDLIDANGIYASYADISREISYSKHFYNFLVFRFTPTTFDWDMNTARMIKKLSPNTKVVGLCYTLGTLSERVMLESPYMDIYIRDGYESVISKLASVLVCGDSLACVEGITYRNSSGEIVANPPASPIEDYNSLPLPAYDLLGDMWEYYMNTSVGSPFSIVYASKGCPYGCKFCNVSRTKWMKRDADSVIYELMYLKKEKKIRTVSFFDETFTIDRDRVEGICKAIRTHNLRIKWYCNTRVDLVDEELLKMMRASGCEGISFGVESGSDKILNSINKGFSVNQAERAIKISKRAGIKVNCSFVVGFPEENKSTIEETKKFVSRTLPNGAQFNVFVPYPGTPLYEEIFCKESKVDWRLLYQDHSITSTENMSSSDIDRTRVNMYRSLYINPGWWLNNIWHVCSQPRDFPMAFAYVRRIFSNFVVHGMNDAH